MRGAFIYLVIILVASFIASNSLEKSVSVIRIQTAYGHPFVKDSSLRVALFADGLLSPTSMAFLDNRTILILEKNGLVRLVIDGTLQEEPVLKLPVNTLSERGLLGIAVGKDAKSVFLYYTEANPLRNRVYKYQWDGQSLDNPTLILDLPADPGPNHDGGKITIGPDGYLYAVIGDLNQDGKLQNFPSGHPPTDSGVILRVNPVDGSAASDNPFVNNENEMLHKYYAYGIRNSFGIDFDPLTDNLWDTENGPADSDFSFTATGSDVLNPSSSPAGFDEINLVRPGFNSGWEAVMGPSALNGDRQQALVNLTGSHYADPVFSWKDSVAPTDIEFYSSFELGDRYANNIFVGDITRGNLYFFVVNENRNGLIVHSIQHQPGLTDFIADDREQISAIALGTGFGGITDIETGPDGFLYVLSYTEGVLYKISPQNIGA